MDTKIDEILTLNRDVAYSNSSSFDFETLWNMVDITGSGALDVEGMAKLCSKFVFEVYRHQEEAIAEDVKNLRDVFLPSKILAVRLYACAQRTSLNEPQLSFLLFMLRLFSRCEGSTDAYLRCCIAQHYKYRCLLTLLLSVRLRPYSMNR